MTLSRLIEELRAMGIRDERILRAIEEVKREFFVPHGYHQEAYANHPLPIGHDQTISQPYTVAFMLEALELKGGEKVLEVGAGSGWNAALLGWLVKPGKVIATEIISELAESAEKNVKRAGIDNVRVLYADGSLGYEAGAPFDRIIVTAACPDIPALLLEQLADSGTLIAPVGGSFFGQDMVKLVKKGKKLGRSNLGKFVFVPLRGEHGI